jgi:putative transposase
MTRFIDRHRDRFGVEPICKVLEIAPSSYYAHNSRPPSARAVRDARLKVETKRVLTTTSRSTALRSSGGSFTGKASPLAATGSPG